MQVAANGDKHSKYSHETFLFVSIVPFWLQHIYNFPVMGTIRYFRYDTQYDTDISMVLDTAIDRYCIGNCIGIGI
jgi:hypothetical protein